MSYYGWTNRATRAFSMWIVEVLGDDAVYRERDRILAELGKDCDKTEAAKDLAEWIHERICELDDEYLPHNAYGYMVRDLLPDIDYLEIAEHYFD